MTGSCLFDGHKPSLKEVKRDTSYVQQQDALTGEFTVYETLMFAAECKLKGPRQKKKERVLEVSMAKQIPHDRRIKLVSFYSVSRCSRNDICSVNVGVLLKFESRV